MTESQVAPLSIGYIIWLVALGGTIGGLAQFLAKVTLWHAHPGSQREPLFAFDEEMMVYLRFGAFLGLFLAAAVIGIAGAGGIAGILVLIKVFDPQLIAATTLQTQLQFQVELFGVSIIAGFIARRLLPILGENLVSRVKEHSKQLEEQRQTGLQLKEENSKLRDELVVERALSVLQSQSVEGWIASEREIMDFLARHPNHRRATIFAARFAAERPPADKRAPDYRKGIEILTRFLNQPNVSDFDYADVIYNRACYYAKLAEDVSGDEKKTFTQRALDDLKESLRRKPENKNEAEADKDTWLKGISNESEFKKLAGS